MSKNTVMYIHFRSSEMPPLPNNGTLNLQINVLDVCMSVKHIYVYNNKESEGKVKMLGTVDLR